MQHNVKSMAERILLVAFTTGGRPRFKRKNRKEAAKVADAHGVDRKKVDTGVDQCTHPALEALDTLHGEAGQWHRDHTMPTVTDGMRQLKLDAQLEYMKVMAEYQAKNQKLLDDFFADYPQLQADAPAVNNGLYDPKPWKPIEVLREAHQWTLQILPCPHDGAWAEWLSASLTIAAMDLQEKLEEAIRKVAERCASDGKLYQSTFDNLKELLAMVPDLNLANDPKIMAIAKQAEMLANQDKDAVVNRPQYRKQLAKEADRLLSIFGGGSAAGPSELPQVCECPSLF